ncbi:cation-transporting P-type ATPase, partial (plasmid) [Lactiplantibacillus plantarum]
MGAAFSYWRKLMTPYNEHKADVLKRLATSRQSGLTSEEAQARLTQHGPNALAASKPLPAWRQFLATLKEPLVIILFIAVLLAWASAGYDFFVRHDPSHG